MEDKFHSYRQEGFLKGKASSLKRMRPTELFWLDVNKQCVGRLFIYPKSCWLFFFIFYRGKVGPVMATEWTSVTRPTHANAS